MFDPKDSVINAVTAYDAAWFAPRVGLIRAEKYDHAGAIIGSWELVEVTLN